MGKGALCRLKLQTERERGEKEADAEEQTFGFLRILSTHVEFDLKEN